MRERKKKQEEGKEVRKKRKVEHEKIVKSSFFKLRIMITGMI